MTPVTLFLLMRARWQPRVLLGVGFVIVAIANLLNARIITTDSTFWTFAFVLILGGIGFGMLFVPLSVAVLSSVSGPDTQKATSLLSLCQQFGGSVSTAVLVTLLDRRGAQHLDALAGEVTRNSVAAMQFLAHAPVALLARIVGQQAATMAFADAFFFLGVVTLILTPLSLLLRPGKGGGGPPVAIAE